MFRNFVIIYSLLDWGDIFICGIFGKKEMLELKKIYS